MAEMDASGVDIFTKAVNQLGEIKLDNISEAFNGRSSVDMLNIGNSFTKIFADGMLNGQDEINQAIDVIVSDMGKLLDDQASSFNTNGLTFMTNLTNGIEDGGNLVTDSIRYMLVSITSDIMVYYGQFYNAGAYLVNGFASGISDNISIAAEQARAMALEAKRAAEEALDINSPSKVFYKIGDFTGQGFINALKQYADKSYTEGSNIGNSVKNGLLKSINKMTGLIENGIDSQPTIRPVIDLSDVRNGAKTIKGMLDSSTFRLTAKANVISSAVNWRLQNGSNSDIVSAINSLRKDLGNLGSTTYSINGITYDDGSNVADAIRTLTRAAIRERRV